MKHFIMIFLILCLSGCGKIEQYEINDIATQCGGYDAIHQMWVDLYSTKAKCVDGTDVKSTKGR